MATQKAEPTDETAAPKKNAITFAKDLSASEKMEALNAAKKALEDELLAELDAQEAELQKQIDAVKARRNAIFPPLPQNEHPAGRPRGPKKEKTQGTQVSLKALDERFKAATDGVLNIRKEKLDLASVKKAVEESKGKYAIGGESPWYTVELAK